MQLPPSSLITAITAKTLWGRRNGRPSFSRHWCRRLALRGSADPRRREAARGHARYWGALLRSLVISFESAGSLLSRLAILSEVRIALPARHHGLRVDVRQSLGGLLSLRRLGHNRPNAIQHDAATPLSAVGKKARVGARHPDPGAWMPGHRLSGRGLCGRKLKGLCQHNEKTNYLQR